MRHNPALVRQILIAWSNGLSWGEISSSSGVRRSTVRDLVSRFITRRELYPDLDLHEAAATLLRDVCYAKPTVTDRDLFFAQRTPGPDGKPRSLRSLAESGEFAGLGKSRLAEINASLTEDFALPFFLRHPRPAGILEICEGRRLYRLDDGRTQRVIVAMAPASGAIAATLLFGPETDKGERGERAGWYTRDFLIGISRLFRAFGGAPRSIQFVERVSPSLRYLLRRQGYAELEDFGRHFGVQIPKMHRPRRIEPNGPRKYPVMRDGDLAPGRGIREVLDMHIQAWIDETALGSVRAFENTITAAVDAWNAQRIQPLGLSHLELYKELDWVHWALLPDSEYRHRKFKRVLVQFDGHCSVGGTRYSVPFGFWDRWLRDGRGRKRGREITALVSDTEVELLVDGDRIVHPRQHGGYATNPAHLASQNKRGNYGNPGFARRAEKVAGREFGDVVRAVIAANSLPERAYLHALAVAKYAHEGNLAILTQRKDDLIKLAGRPKLKGQDVVKELKAWGCWISREVGKEFGRLAERQPHVGRVARR